MRRASLSSGFGFTVTGGCPVSVGRVTSQSAAAEAGMRRGDLIQRVGDVNVSRSSADSVASLIRSVMTQSIARGRAERPLTSHADDRCTVAAAPLSSGGSRIC